MSDTAVKFGSGTEQIPVAMIVAMAENRVIGRDNQLPWHLPGDLKYFKATTLGKPVIMGRLTFESIGRPLPGRTNIVVTRNPDWSAEGVRVVHSATEAVALARDIARAEGAAEVMVIGGAQLYAELLPTADRLYLTRVHAEVEGDACFPVLEPGQWRQLQCQEFAAEGANPYAYSLIVYQRERVPGA